VVSVENVHLSARLSAYIRQVHVTAGDQVTKGQVLVSLDDRELREQLAAAEAQLKQASIEYERTRTLKSAKATTDQALVAARTAYEAARAQMQRLKVMLSFSEIISPLDGKVTDRRIEVGDLANPGQVLLTVYDPKHMRVEAPAPIRLAGKLAVGQEVEVTLDWVDHPLTGRVSEVVAEVDPASRTQVVKVLLGDMGADVLPGTFARLWVADDPRPTLLIPASAVYRSGQLELVQVKEGDRALRRLVKTGAVRGQAVEILSGLAPGEKVLRKPIL
jgi:RND family efflux transporter MFP subunit